MWANIINSVNDIWPSIQIIFEQNDLINEASDAIQKVKTNLGKKPEEASKIIKFLDSKNKYELEELGIADRKESILKVRKVISKRNIMLQLEEKCQTLELTMNRVFKFDILR